MNSGSGVVPTVVLSLMTLGAFVYTVLAYPNKYGALTGRSRLFRTIGVCLLDLLLLLVLLMNFIDWHSGLSPRAGSVRAVFYLASCLFLCFALVMVAALDALESYSAVRKERRVVLERMLREQVMQARVEAAENTAENSSARTTGDPDDRA